MAEQSVITQEMRDAIGVESEPVTHQVERGAIIKFAQAIGDPNPLYNDEEAARETHYGGLIAPPTFLRSMLSGPSKVEFERPYSAGLDGGSEWEYFEPVRVGDRITVTDRIADLYERQGRPGEHGLHHQRDEVRQPVRPDRGAPADHRHQLRAVVRGLVGGAREGDHV